MEPLPPTAPTPPPPPLRAWPPTPAPNPPPIGESRGGETRSRARGWVACGGLDPRCRHRQLRFAELVHNQGASVQLRLAFTTMSARVAVAPSGIVATASQDHQSRLASATMSATRAAVVPAGIVVTASAPLLFDPDPDTARQDSRSSRKRGKAGAPTLEREASCGRLRVPDLSVGSGGVMKAFYPVR